MPRTTLTPRVSSQGSMPRVVAVVDHLVAPGEHGRHVELAGHGLGRAGDAARLVDASAGRSSAFDGMQP